MTTAATIPSRAPAPAVVGSSALWKAATRKTAVSSPSRKTAKNAIATSALTEPSASAARVLSRSSPARPRAWRRIHTTMNVTMPTATAPTIVSSISCSRWGSCSSTTCSVMPTARQIAAAASTPVQSQRSAPRAPSWRRKVAMIETMSTASTPSRRPMTNVGSMGGHIRGP